MRAIKAVKAVTEMTDCEFEVLGARVRLSDIMFVGFIACAACLARLSLFPIVSGDFTEPLSRWMEEFRTLGYARDTNYASAYLFLMQLLSMVSSGRAGDLEALKFLSIAFDLSAALAASMIALQMTRSSFRAALAFSLVALSPALLLNSAYWAQCDSIYCSFLLWAFWCFLRGRAVPCAVLFGVALSFKLQAAFMLPFYAIMWLRGSCIKFRHCLLLPAVFALSVLPGWLSGVGTLYDLFAVYVKQAGYYKWGTLNFPNIYALLGEAMPNAPHAAEVSAAGIYVTLAALGLLAYWVLNRRGELTDGALLCLAMLSFAIAVYCLPHMHERYALMLDLLAAVWACVDGRRLPLFCAVSLISVVVYMPFLISRDIFPLAHAAVAFSCVLVWLARRMIVETSAASP